MKKFRELISRPFVTVALFALALVLLGGSTLGGARAALTVESQVYDSQVQTSNIDVTLLENDKPVNGSNALFAGLLKEGESLQIGKTYPERLAVTNTGTIDEYVRVTVYKYWMKPDPDDPTTYKKVADMNSAWIDLEFDETSGWTIDKESRTDERTVLYYANPLAKGVASSEFLKSFTIKEDAARTVTQTNGSEIITTYVYEGSKFCLEVHVDSVQTHNADKAKTSAWGVNK